MAGRWQSVAFKPINFLGVSANRNAPFELYSSSTTLVLMRHQAPRIGGGVAIGDQIGPGIAPAADEKLNCKSATCARPASFSRQNSAPSSADAMVARTRAPISRSICAVSLEAMSRTRTSRSNQIARLVQLFHLSRRWLSVLKLRRIRRDSRGVAAEVRYDVAREQFIRANFSVPFHSGVKVAKPPKRPVSPAYVRSVGWHRRGADDPVGRSAPERGVTR